MIAGLEPVDDGEIAIGGIPMSTREALISPEDRGVGLVFQDFALFPHLTVADNIGFGLAGVATTERHTRVAALLARFDIERLQHSWPHMLSGGEQQRVAIARALARAPAVLLLDEPFSGLDGHLRAAVRQSMLSDLRAAGTAVLIVTHDPEEAMLMADDLVLMAAGRILQFGNPEECYLRPTSEAAARLLGEVSIIPARIMNGLAHTAFGLLPAQEFPDCEASILVRPEAVRLDDAGMAANIVDVRFVGAAWAVVLSSGDAVISARMRGAVPGIGTRVGVAIDTVGTAIIAG